MRGSAWLVLLLTLAGCSQAPAVPEGIPVDARGEALPTVEGYVVDEAIRPLEGATVRFLGTDVQATTDLEGHYRIFRPTPQAEAALVTATMPGFIPRTQQVQVSGHVAARLDFGLESNPYTIPHVDVLEHRTTLGCQLQVAVAGPPERLSCDPPDPTGPDDGPPPTSWWFNPTPGLAGVVVEVHWTPQSPFEQRLHALLRAPAAGGEHGSPGDVQAETEGESPLRLEIPENVARGFGEWTAIVLELSVPAGGSTQPVSLSRDQLVEAYATLFYVDPAPPGYTLG